MQFITCMSQRSQTMHAIARDNINIGNIYAPAQALERLLTCMEIDFFLLKKCRQGCNHPLLDQLMPMSSPILQFADELTSFIIARLVPNDPQISFFEQSASDLQLTYCALAICK